MFTTFKGLFNLYIESSIEFGKISQTPIHLHTALQCEKTETEMSNQFQRNLFLCSFTSSVHTYKFKGPFIYYVITFLGFFDPPPLLRNRVFSTENNKKWAFSDPPPPYK